MFKRIMVPVDMAHQGEMTRAIECATKMGAEDGAEIIFVSVTSSAPTSTAHNPAEFETKLAAFAKTFGAKGHVVISHDPSSDLEDKLLGAVSETQADLVVMASHKPTFTDWLWPSNGGSIARHADCSVMLVR